MASPELELAPHPLPLELIRYILESCVQRTINEEPSIAVDLQLVSRTVREWLAPLIYAVFALRPPRADSKESDCTPAASSSLRSFQSFLQTSPDDLSARRHVQTLAIEPDPHLEQRIQGMFAAGQADLFPIWKLDTVLVPSLAAWYTISQFTRGALQPRAISCVEQLLAPFAGPLISCLTRHRSQWNGLKGVNELRVCLDRDAVVPDMLQSRRRQEIVGKLVKLQELRLARLQRRDAESTGFEQPALPALYEFSGWPASVVLRTTLHEERDMALLKEAVRQILTRDVSGDEMKVIVEVLQTDKRSPYLVGCPLLHELRAAVDPQLSDRLSIQVGGYASCTARTVAEDVHLRRMGLISDCA